MIISTVEERWAGTKRTSGGSGRKCPETAYTLQISFHDSCGRSDRCEGVGRGIRDQWYSDYRTPKKSQRRQKRFRVKCRGTHVNVENNFAEISTFKRICWYISIGCMRKRGQCKDRGLLPPRIIKGEQTGIFNLEMLATREGPALRSNHQLKHQAEAVFE